MMQRPSASLCGALMFAALSAAACNSGLTNDDRRAIHAWLTCDDCASGQRAAVEALGDKAVPGLSDALKGPTAEQRAIMSGKFDSSFSRADMSARVPGFSIGAYTTFRNANYVANYQKRAAISLGDIGTDAAKSALDGAIGDSVNRQYRTDVVRVIKFARSRLDAPTYGGVIRPYRLGFADTVRIFPPPTQHFSSQASVVIEDSLFPAAELPIDRFPDSLRFPSVAATGVHMVSVLTSPNAVPDKIAMFVTSVADVTDRSPPPCTPPTIVCLVTNAPPVPVVPASSTQQKPVFFTLNPGTNLESMEFYKVVNPAPASPLAVTAQVYARGPSGQQVRLQWYNCAGAAVDQPTQGPTGPNKINFSRTIPGGGCSVLQIALIVGPGPVYGQLIVTTP